MNSTKLQQINSQEDFEKIINGHLPSPTELIDELENFHSLLYDALGSDNLRCRLNKSDDVRKSENYKIFANKDKDSVCQGFAGYWNPEQSDGQISREVFMRLNRKTSMISFYRDCLASEVDYAIKRIRET